MTATWQGRWSIQEVGPRLGVSARTLRFYEERGLVRPSRAENGVRLYDHAAVARLSQVVALRRYGLSVDQIRQALQGDGQEALIDEVRKLRAARARQLQGLDRLLAQLEGRAARDDDRQSHQ